MFVLLPILAGCAITPPAPVVSEQEKLRRWEQHQQQIANIHSWSIHGRVALFVDDEVYNLGLNWTFSEHESTLKLEAALGQGVIQLEKNGSQVSLMTSEGETYFGDNAEQVLTQSTRLSIPVDGLEFWIKGIQHNQSAYTPVLNNSGLASSITQDQWKINYLDYTEAALPDHNNPLLPHKMYMKRQNIALKIVIDQWQPQQNISSSDLFPVFPE